MKMHEEDYLSINVALDDIPGVEKAMVKDLRDLGVYSVKDLDGCDSGDLYKRICHLRGQKLDLCVLYVFRFAAYYASKSSA